MKTTIEIPDTLFRRAKVSAAHRGVTMKQLVEETLREKLGESVGAGKSEEPAWRSEWRTWNPSGRVKTEARRIGKLIESEFETIDPGDTE